MRQNSSEVAPFIKSPNPSQEDWFENGLKGISDLIIEQQRNLIPHKHDLTRSEIERVDALWRRYFREGISLSNGGVEDCFFSPEDLEKILSTKESLKSFNIYRSDRTQSVKLGQEQLKKFLLEEGLISDKSDQNNLSVEFSLGSHEAFTRIISCLRSKDVSEIIYPAGGYGLLSRAASTLKPDISNYRVHLTDIDRSNGEKVKVEDIEKIAQKNPKAKILYLESKTTAGAIYNEQELEEIVKCCKKQGLFLILDSAHLNMEFSDKDKFPDLTSIAQKYGHKDFAVLYTGSKTYGLERARVGFICTGDEDLAYDLNKNFSKTLGSMGDLQYEISKELMESPLEKRREFIEQKRHKHYYNMNLMIAYIEGVNSPDIDENLRSQISAEIPPEFQSGIDGMNISYKPDGGIQMKVDVSRMQDKYLTNIRMFNSEIFAYAIHKFSDVVTLHSHQIMDSEGFGMRLSFSVKDDIHCGMQEIHKFTNCLTDKATPNKFMPEILAEDLIFPSSKDMDIVVEEAKIKSAALDVLDLNKKYEENIRNSVPKHVVLSEDAIKESIEKAAGTIKKAFSHRPKSSISNISGSNISSEIIEKGR